MDKNIPLITSIVKKLQPKSGKTILMLLSLIVLLSHPSCRKQEFDIPPVQNSVASAQVYERW